MFATTVRDGFDPAERVEIFELLWEVVYADDRLARLEQDLIAHLARELGIDAAQSEAARLEAFARIRGGTSAMRGTGTACER